MINDKLHLTVGKTPLVVFFRCIVEAFNYICNMFSLLGRYLSSPKRLQMEELKASPIMVNKDVFSELNSRKFSPVTAVIPEI